MRELAIVQADKIKSEKVKFSVVHRRDGDVDFVNALISELATEVNDFIKNFCSSIKIYLSLRRLSCSLPLEKITMVK